MGPMGPGPGRQILEGGKFWRASNSGSVVSADESEVISKVIDDNDNTGNRETYASTSYVTVENSDQVDEAQDKEIFIPSDDPFYWKVSEATRDYFAKNGINQNSDIDFFNSKRIYPDKSRFLTKSLFEQKLDYLVYSNSQG